MSYILRPPARLAAQRFVSNHFHRSRFFTSRLQSTSGGVYVPFTPFLISLEGNIGAGKTTLLNKLRESHPEWIAIDEPVDTWSTIRNEANESILEIFYKDRKRWSYTFQNCALLTRYQNIESCINSSRSENAATGGVHIFLTERCLDTDYHVFTKMLRDEGSIDKLELELYERLLVQLRTTATPLSAIIHVNTPPTLCAQRIKQRGRNGEEAITLDYLESLDMHQTKWVRSTDVPTLSTDVTNFGDIEQFIAKQVQDVVRNTLVTESRKYEERNVVFRSNRSNSSDDNSWR